MTEITNARVHADLESVRLAELYAGHPLLKYMPIPHFRLPTITIDVPVVMKDIESEKKETQTPDQILTNMRRSFDKFLIPQMQSIGIKPSEKIVKEINQELDNKLTDLKPIQKMPLSTTYVTNEFVNLVIKILRESYTKELNLEEEHLAKLTEGLKHSSYVEFSQFIRSPQRLNVLVTTAELREAGPSDILTTLHLTVSESGMEWDAIESKGQTQSRLVPE